jgi:hypothetical protein
MIQERLAGGADEILDARLDQGPARPMKKGTMP